MDRRSFLGSALGGFVLLQDPGAAADPLRIPAAAGRSRAPVTDYSNDPVVQATEKQLKCTCGCNLDIYTCRTTDFTCGTSPELHKEIVALFQQGLTPEEVIAAFVAQHGEAALMAPKPEGFNLAGYLVPGLAVLTAGAILALVVFKRSRHAVTAPAAAAPVTVAEASTEEMERLKRALSEVAD